MRIQLALTIPEGTPINRLPPLTMVLRALAEVNQWHHQNGHYAPLYTSGVRYVMEPKGEENWQDIPSLYAAEKGDCEDLAAARCGELWAGKGLVSRGGRLVPQRHPINARPVIKWRELSEGLTMVHCLVLWPNGKTEDPSRLLGMRGVDGYEGA